MSHVVWNSFIKELFDRNWNNFLMKYGVGDNNRGVKIDFRRSSLMDSNLSRSPPLGRDEKYTKERKYTCFFKQYDNCLGSRKHIEIIRCCRFLYRHTLCNKILNRSSISACV
ncbi:hypothetical protein Ahy_B09g097841 [Arachis hypogaea]|uniref:Protein FAR1-RELATED SEQUENCE n=1 Tax=Arachis hypogaea TaxID=3818 RepID=A0A444XPY9_ARAHY|nr:hypothetical protein Ahy_B09g097841 [Arachis hypogaea]